MERNYGGIEAGGTKFVCAVGSHPDNLFAQITFPTTTPAETLDNALAFFRQHAALNLQAIGIGSFGPLDLNPASPTFGYITSTPKPGWAMFDLAGTVRHALGLPVFIDTDVNAAALGEHTWGAAQDVQNFLYLTIGTGIGGGVMANGQLLHGLLHPELGHIRIPHDLTADPFPGVCPYHGDCFEGLATGPSMRRRWGQPAETLPPEHPAWNLEAHYLALACANFICTLSPERIVLGGGVMQAAHLFPRVRAKVQQLLNGYVASPAITTNHIESYLVPPGLGNRAGVCGSIALCQP